MFNLQLAVIVSIIVFPVVGLLNIKRYRIILRTRLEEFKKYIIDSGKVTKEELKRITKEELKEKLIKQFLDKYSNMDPDTVSNKTIWQALLFSLAIGILAGFVFT